MFTFNVTQSVDLAELNKSIAELKENQAVQTDLLRKIMANSLAAKEALQELNDVINTLADAVGQLAASDQAEDDAFKAKIKELEDKLRRWRSGDR